MRKQQKTDVDVHKTQRKKNAILIATPKSTTETRQRHHKEEEEETETEKEAEADQPPIRGLAVPKLKLTSKPTHMPKETEA